MVPTRATVRETRAMRSDGKSPAVEAAGVVGVPHPHSGEAVRAYVVVREGAHVDEDDLIAHAGRHLARYKCPSSIAFVDELPVGITGKLLRRALR